MKLDEAGKIHLTGNFQAQPHSRTQGVELSSTSVNWLNEIFLTRSDLFVDTTQIFLLNLTL